MRKRAISDYKPFEFRISAAGKQRCRNMAAQEGVSMSELIRRAVVQYADRQEFDRNLKAFLTTTGLGSDKG